MATRIKDYPKLPLEHPWRGALRIYTKRLSIFFIIIFANVTLFGVWFIASRSIPIAVVGLVITGSALCILVMSPPSSQTPQPLYGPAKTIEQRPRFVSPSRPQAVSRTIPIVSEIAAGKPVIASDDVIGEIQWTGEKFLLGRQVLQAEFFKGTRLRFSPEYSYFAMPVSGDSMERAGITPGDFVILQRSKSRSIPATSGDIVAVRLSDSGDIKGTTLKRITVEHDRITLRPESFNPAHIPAMLSPHAFVGDNPGALIAGIVIAVTKAKRARRQTSHKYSMKGDYR